MRNNMLWKKGLVVGIIVLFVGISVIPSTGKMDVTTSGITVYDGSLSGYVNDTSMNPIGGVRVRVYFHGTYEEDYSDSTGYYHVTNIPICWCVKNCTASKDGYTTEWVWLAIYEDTTYDFVLSCISLQADANGPYFQWDYEPIQFYGSAYCGSEPYTWHWDFGDSETSEEQNPIHHYLDTGEYTVVLTITDSENNIAKDTTLASMYCHPWQPIINGPNHGKPGINYEYAFLAIHPSGDLMSYFIDWNDGTITDWTLFQECDEPYRENHIWDSEGTYIIKAKAKLYYGCESDWATLKVTMSRNRAINTPFLNFLQQHPNLFPILQKILLQR